MRSWRPLAERSSIRAIQVFAKDLLDVWQYGTPIGRICFRDRYELWENQHVGHPVDGEEKLAQGMGVGFVRGGHRNHASVGKRPGVSRELDAVWIGGRFGVESRHVASTRNRCINIRCTEISGAQTCTHQLRQRAVVARPEAMYESFTCDPHEISYINTALRLTEPPRFGQMESPRSLDRTSKQDGPLMSATGNKVQRLAQHTQRLVDDLKTWVDLRIELAQIELEERVEAKVNEIALGVIVGGIVLLAVIFGLTALSFGLGAWLGHPGWGFLVVTILLILLAVVLRAARPEFVQVGHHTGPSSDRDADAPSASPSA